MATMTNREKRTVRLGAAGIALYLVLYGGFEGWKFFQAKHREYQQLVTEAPGLKKELQPYEDKVLVAKKLMEDFRLDPAKLTSATVMAEASAAIQQAAQSGGVGLGSIRESPGRTSAKELGSMQLEGGGPLPAVMGLLHRLSRLGYPLILDSVQISPEVQRPGMVKVSLTVIILDFEQWKTSEAPNA
jgi:hypothetical protein